jgi:pimeloyl-ACP methyl ester carboxylesterase
MKYFCCVLIILFSFVLQIQAAEQGKNKIMAANGRNLVILIHGFSRGAEDMQFWKEHLSMENTDVLIPDLPTVFESFERCLEVLSDVIAAKEPEKYSAVYIAGHSMGGLLAREYLQKYKLPNAKRLVCVGTPHSGSKLADIALKIPGAGKIWKPLHALKLSARTKLTTPDIPGLEIGVIVSTNNAHWPGKLFLSPKSDGLVESSSAHAPDAKAAVYVKAHHVGMMYDKETALLIRKFFIEGNF